MTSLHQHALSTTSGNRIHCFRCSRQSICIQWRRSLSLHLEIPDIEELLGCMTEVLGVSRQQICMGCRCSCTHDPKAGCYYLLCHDSIVLRLRPDEAYELHDQLTRAHAELGASARHEA